MNTVMLTVSNHLPETHFLLNITFEKASTDEIGQLLSTDGQLSGSRYDLVLKFSRFSAQNICLRFSDIIHQF
jgi:hypothetical protein